jgi:CoA:oxalate CoA-transferase
MTESRPLDGLLVLELSQFIAGPVCGMVLADHGANVVKIERPSGEDGRRIGPFVNDESLYYAVFNRNKRGITIDISSGSGQSLLRELASHADIIIENYRPGVLARFGVGYEELSKLNSRLIFVSLSGFGQYGPYRDLPAFDQTIQAMSGVMYMNGYEDDPPLKLGLSVSDYAAGLHAAIGVLLATTWRERTGVGQLVDVALLDSLTFMLETATTVSGLLGDLPKRVGNGRPGAAPGSAYRCRDGWIYIAATSDSIWQRFIEAIDRPDLGTSAHYQTNADRVTWRKELDAEIEAWCARKDAGSIVDLLRSARVPCAPVRDVNTLHADPQMAAREMLVNVQHPRIGPLTVPGVPVKLSGSPGCVTRPAPTLGQHNTEVYGELLGLSAVDVTRLREERAI